MEYNDACLPTYLQLRQLHISFSAQLQSQGNLCHICGTKIVTAASFYLRILVLSCQPPMTANKLAHYHNFQPWSTNLLAVAPD
jgi:hypothetical protein